MIISMIAAASINGIIGRDEHIPWQIPGEQIRFKELTLGKTIIMGRKTYESIGIAGGGEIYKEALPLAGRLYLTEIEQEIAGNIYFPDFDKDNFQLTFQQRVGGTIPYTYYTYERLKKE